MKNRIISMMMTFTLCFGMVGYFKIPKFPAIPNITKSITLPKIEIPEKYLENIRLNVKVVL